MEDKGAVMSIKFSPEYRILAIQRGAYVKVLDGKRNETERETARAIAYV